MTAGEVANCQVADSLMPTLSQARNKNIGLILDRVGFFHDELLKFLQDVKQGAGRNWPCQETYNHIFFNNQKDEKGKRKVSFNPKQLEANERRDQPDLHLAVSS